MKARLASRLLATTILLSAASDAAAATFRYDYHGGGLSMVSPATGATFRTSGFNFSVLVDEALLGDTIRNGFSFHVGIGRAKYPYTFDYYWAADTQALAKYPDTPSNWVDANGGIALEGMDVINQSDFGGIDFAVAADGTISWNFFAYYFDYASLFSSGAGDILNTGQTVTEIIRHGPEPWNYDWVYTPLNYSGPARQWTVVATVPLPWTLPALALALAGLFLAGSRPQGRRVPVLG